LHVWNVALQLPEQHCASALQAVEPPRQQMLFMQENDTESTASEQQSWSATQGPPAALQAQLPFLQTPVQHWLSPVHATGANSQQRPWIERSEQQASGVAAIAPSAAQQYESNMQVSPAQQPPPAPHDS
jgi:hypothetical protein